MMPKIVLSRSIGKTKTPKIGNEQSRRAKGSIYGSASGSGDARHWLENEKK
jgi:hypothetical protein